MAEMFWIFVGHFLGDYILQTDYIAKNKCNHHYIMFIHCLLYTATIVFIMIILGFGDMWRWGFAIFLSHIVLDYVKCSGQWPDKYALAIDQTAHLVILAMVRIGNLTA